MGLVQGHIQEDNQDTMSSHEVLHPGQLYGMVLKEALDVSMLQTRAYIKKTCDPNSRGRKLSLVEYVNDKEVLRRAFTQSCDVQKRLENFLATGNVKSRSGLDLLQVSGFTVVADKLNQARYSSHFAAVHRGQYFAEMKTTTVRKLLPETWGFLCPVHTPDGSPCGLLNHLAHSCKPVVKPVLEQEISAVLQAQDIPEAMEVCFAFPASHGADDKGAGNREEQFEKEAFEKLKEQPPPPTLIFTLRPGRSWLQPL
ncbi:unnamed protein product [Cladocopium goreaui]|uniref:DNA-directed RNA polymerase n=1 Tax=Cladocopium goreaui TaxID=2562237 RepID=A0A9P1GRY1_9DINO|nr:unnamed protein product [Cladocopium goreaui]